MRPPMRRGWTLPLIAAVSALLLLAPSAASAAGSGQSGLLGHPHFTAGDEDSHALSANALPAGVQVVASGLDQPRKIVVGPDGSLYVTEAGTNVVPTGCTDGTEQACANPSGSVVNVTPSGQVTPVVTGLPSINGGPGSPGASGPSGITISNGDLQFLTQNGPIDQTTGDQTFGPVGALLGSLLSAPLTGTTSPTQEAYLGTYEAQNNPDGGAGAAATGQSPIDSDPYAVTPYDGGLAIADAAANDVLLYKNGSLSTLAVLPLISEPAGGGTTEAQGVPTSLAVGPDGALYIGELGGAPNDANDVNVYRYANGTLSVYASGFSMIGDIAFDQAGRLLVLEMDTAGFADTDPGGLPTAGALIRVNADGTKTTLASTGLEYPGGMAVAKDGSIYVTNWTILDGSDDPNLPPGANVGGEIVRVSDDSVADQVGASYGGYREVASDGGVFTFGNFGFYGSMGGTKLNEPVVGIASTPLSPGYWEVASDGGIFSFGTASFYGSMGGKPLNAPIVGIASTPDGRGYLEFASDGGVFAFGDAGYYGSMGGTKLNKPIVGGAVTPDGKGYWLFASDGGVFSFGDAGYYGSEGGKPLNQPVVGGATSPTGGGYYLVAADGGIFAFGSATFQGSMGGTKLNKPVVGIEVTPNNSGYYEVASDGGIFAFPNSTSTPFYGSMGGKALNQPIVGMG